MDQSGWAPKLAIDGYTSTQVSYNAYLLIDAGLAKGQEVTTMGSEGPVALITSLTWAGHEFAGVARDDIRWKKVMGIVKDKGETITLDLLKQLIGSLMRGTFGLP